MVGPLSNGAISLRAGVQVDDEIRAGVTGEQQRDEEYEWVGFHEWFGLVWSESEAFGLGRPIAT